MTNGKYGFHNTALTWPYVKITKNKSIIKLVGIYKWLQSKNYIGLTHHSMDLLCILQLLSKVFLSSWILLPDSY